jgi:hypothetical protein
MALNTFTRLIVGFSQNSSLTSHKLLSACCKPQTHTKQKVNLEENFNWHGSMACEECCGLSRPFKEATTMASIASSFHSLQKALRKKKTFPRRFFRDDLSGSGIAIFMMCKRGEETRRVTRDLVQWHRTMGFACIVALLLLRCLF